MNSDFKIIMVLIIGITAIVIFAPGWWKLMAFTLLALTPEFV